MPGKGRRFRKGKSGNPGGRPSAQWIRDYLTGLNAAGNKSKRLQILDALYLTSIDRRHREHVKAGLGLLAYDAGKPLQSVELTGEGGGPVQTEDATGLAAVLERIDDMTTGALRKQLAALRARREQMMKEPKKELAPIDVTPVGDGGS